MQSKLDEYEVRSVTILGVAGGNGLQHIDCSRIQAVYGIDLNQSYLDECREKYLNLKDFLVLKKSDLSDLENVLPAADSPYAEAFNGIASLNREYRKGFPFKVYECNRLKPDLN